MEKLKVGDVIYAEHYKKITGKYTVSRVTKTQAVCQTSTGDVKFRLEYHSPNSIRYIGAGIWGSACYRLENEEVKNRLFRQNTLSKIENTNMSALSTEKLTSILQIILNP